MSIHSRASATAVLEELKGIDGIPILHWFTGTKSELKRAIDIGCWFSIGPAMLNTKKGIELVSNIPHDRILTETDGPFSKYNNNVLMPWDCDVATRLLAKCWDLCTDEASQILLENLRNIVQKNTN